MFKKYKLMIDDVLACKEDMISCSKATDILLNQLLEDYPSPDYSPDGEYDVTELELVGRLLGFKDSNELWIDWPANVPGEFLTPAIFPIMVIKYLLSNRVTANPKIMAAFPKFSVRYQAIIVKATDWVYNEKV
jgi:hypothetical protein